MAYIDGLSRNQTFMFPERLEDYIDAENLVRIFDAFVNSLNMKECGFARHVPATEGRPGYDPRDMAKLYVYGYFHKVRSSRSLEKETKRNVEVMWLINKLCPDFRTISDFRKDNHKALKKMFKEFNKLCVHLDLFSHEYDSVDGSKFRAVNTKDRNFTMNKLDERLERLEKRIAEFMQVLEQTDQTESDTRSFTKTEIEEKINALKERKTLYSGYREQMEKTKSSQLSLTDPEARLMKTHEGYKVCYNVQTAVDAKHHLIAGFEATNQCTDQGLLETVTREVKEDFGLETIEAVADKGYRDNDDLLNCFFNGTIPNVPPSEGATGIELETTYVETIITESQKASTKSADLQACLQSGVIPDIYTQVITSTTVEEKVYYDSPDAATEETSPVMTEQEMLSKAKEGCFVRDIEKNKVYCPQGKVLRQASTRKNGSIRYSNKSACADCPSKCTKAKVKEVDFSPGKIVHQSQGSKQGENAVKKSKGVKKTKRVVKITFVPDRKKLDMRKCLSEHPFGTIKRALGASYLLLKGKEKANGELALFCLVYNLKRALNILGTRKIMDALA